MTRSDRWWWAFVVLGAALIMRAPSWGWAVFVLVMWAFALAQPWELIVAHRKQRELRKEYLRKQDGNWQPTPITEQQLDRLRRTGSSTECVAAAEPISRAEMERLADPTITLPKVPAGPAQGAGTGILGEVRKSGRVIITLKGTIWTTETLLDEIQSVIQKAKDRGDAV